MMRQFRRNPTEDERAAVANELSDLKRNEKDLLNDLNTARAHGDLKENFQYHAAKEALRMARTREEQLKKMLAEESAPLPPEQEALIGAIVRYDDEDKDVSRIVQITPAGRGNPPECLVDVRSPLVAGMAFAARNAYDKAYSMLMDADALATRQRGSREATALRKEALTKLKLVLPGITWETKYPAEGQEGRVVTEYVFPSDPSAGVPAPYPLLTFTTVMDRQPHQGGRDTLIDPVVRTFTLVSLQRTRDDLASVKRQQEESKAALAAAQERRSTEFKEHYSSIATARENGRVRRNPVLDLTIQRHAEQLRRSLNRRQLEQHRVNLQSLVYGTDPGKLAYQYATLSRENLIRLIYLLADA